MRGETMDRRVVIAVMFLVMALLGLMIVEMGSAMTAAGTPAAHAAALPCVTVADGAAVAPQPSPAPAPQVAYQLMSGDCACRYLA